MGTEYLALGIEMIDKQHAELFKRLEMLLDACVNGSCREEAVRMLKFLNSYVDIHFAAEEELMREYDHPEYRYHRFQHDDFLRHLDYVKRDIDARGITTDLVLHINQMLIDWLKQHILEVDKAMTDYLKSRLAAQPTG